LTGRIRTLTTRGVVISGTRKTRVLRARTALVAATSLAMAVTSVVLAAPSQAAGPQTAKSVTGSHPDWASAARDAGTAPAATEYTGTVYLAGQDAAGLAAYAKAVSDPNSASYGKFISPAEYNARFGATKAQIATVRGWLESAGLEIVRINEHAITVKGTNAAMSKAFGTSIHRYKVAGALLHAPAHDVTVPADVASAVLGVTGLTSPRTNVAKPAHATVSAGTSAGTSNDGLPPGETCSEYFGQKLDTSAPNGYVDHAVPFDQCSLYPSQLRKAYGITASGLTGKGATVAIIDAYGSSTMRADANQYAVNHGDKPFRPGQYVEDVDPSQWTDTDLCGGADGWAGEEALDVEMVHGLAPDAKVRYVGANSCTDDDLLGAITSVVDAHSADVITNSWGEIMHTTDDADVTPTTIAAYTQVFEQAAAEGITINFSAGDCGDSSPTAAATGANCQTDTPRAQANWPDSSPWVTAVGGTALGLSNKKGAYGFETDMGTLLSPLSADGTGWNPLPGDFYFGGGGGTSEDFAQPWYQRGVVPGSLAHTLATGAKSKTAQRVTPDVAMNGDLYTSVLVGMSDGAPYSEGGYGGTSVSSPEFAAVQADAIQAQHHPLGFANPEIYLRARFGVFHDVVDEAALHHQAPLSNVTFSGHYLVAFGEDTTLNATPGYDDATGVGSPTANYLRSFER
jgi:subtilase family serine protease